MEVAEALEIWEAALRPMENLLRPLAWSCTFINYVLLCFIFSISCGMVMLFPGESAFNPPLQEVIKYTQREEREEREVREEREEQRRTREDPE